MTINAFAKIRRAILGIAFGTSLFACSASNDANDTLADADILDYATTSLESSDLRDFALGRHNDTQVVVTFMCSDLCPAYTERIIHYELPNGTTCESVKGRQLSVAVPMGIGIGSESFCFPEVLAKNWEKVVSQFDEGHPRVATLANKQYTEYMESIFGSGSSSESTPEDKEELLTSYRQKAEAGDPLAMHNLAVRLRADEYSERDFDGAAYWYRKAAEMGFAGSQNNLGDMYEQGDGLPKSASDAIYWYTQAAMQGEPTAYFSLGSCFASGTGVLKDTVTAHAWLSLAVNGLPDGFNKRDALKMLADVEGQMTESQIASAKHKAENFHPLSQTDLTLGDRMEE